MINVLFDKKSKTLHVEGHAGKAPAGENLLCAAASMLDYALEAHCLKHPEYESAITRNENTGTFDVWMKTRGGLKALQVMADGYQLLAEYYPDDITYEERSK